MQVLAECRAFQTLGGLFVAGEIGGQAGEIGGHTLGFSLFRDARLLQSNFPLSSRWPVAQVMEIRVSTLVPQPS